jgi:quercetin dioxygenase-like cupin family protein
MAKRVVTGQRPDGTSCLARVDEVEPTGMISKLWADDWIPVLPADGRSVPLRSRPAPEETQTALDRNPSPHPGSVGYRANLITLPPGPVGGWHWHDTCDLIWVLDGELSVEMDGGDEVTLIRGDLLVQNGTNHRWKAGPSGARMGLVMLGAKRLGVEPPRELYIDHSFILPDDVEPNLLDRSSRGEPSVRATRPSDVDDIGH